MSLFPRAAGAILLAWAIAYAGAASAQQPRSPALPPEPPPPLIAPAPHRPVELAPHLRRLSAQPQQTDDEFEPISEVPPEDRLPAAPLLVSAYVFALLAMFAYVFSVARRLAAVKQDMNRLESELKRTGRS